MKEQLDNSVTIIKKKMRQNLLILYSPVSTKYMGILKLTFTLGDCYGNTEIESGCNMESGSKKKMVRKRLEAKYKEKLGNIKHFSVIIKKHSSANSFNDLNHQYQPCKDNGVGGGVESDLKNVCVILTGKT